MIILCMFVDVWVCEHEYLCMSACDYVDFDFLVDLCACECAYFCHKHSSSSNCNGIGDGNGNTESKVNSSIYYHNGNR